METLNAEETIHRVLKHQYGRSTVIMVHEPSGEVGYMVAGGGLTIVRSTGAYSEELHTFDSVREITDKGWRMKDEAPSLFHNLLNLW